MSSLSLSARVTATLLLVVCWLVLGAADASAHARYARSEPAAGAIVDGAPFVLKAWFSQELTSKSTLMVMDANGLQVDLGDGRVDLDDPIRKLMLVSLPELPAGIYRVEFGADSAEDGHTYHGSFSFGVGMEAPSEVLSSD